MANVTEIFADQQAYAADVGRTVDSLATSLGNLASLEVNVGSVDDAGHTFYDAVNALAGDLVGSAPVAPDFQIPSDVVAPTAPTVSFSTIPDIVVPDFTQTPAQITIPQAPSPAAVQAPGPAPELSQPALPTPPDMVIPPVPTLTQINLPTPPTIDLPTFTTTAPVAAFAAPSNNFAWAEAEYTSAMLDEVKAKLLTDLQEGGYGIETTDETRLWDRMLEREYGQAAANVEEVERTFAARRFPVPPGAMYRNIDRARQALQDAASTGSREVAIKRGDLLVQNRQFTFDKAVQVEGVLINFHTAKMERLLNAAKYTAQFAIDFFTAQVAAYAARLDGYKAEAAVFESLVRAQVEKLNGFRAALEAERLKGEIDKTRLEAYAKQLAGLDTQIALYRARMQGAEVQANIEKLKIEAYRATVDSYVASVRARELEFQGYETRIRGEEAKARVFEIQARAYSTQVEGLKTRADVNATRFRSEVERANAQIALYAADNQRFRTEWEGKVDLSKLNLGAFEAAVSAYRARSQAQSEVARLGVANYAANTTDFLGVLRHNLDKAALELKADESNRAHKVTTTKSLMDFYTQLVVGALAGINAVATQSTTE